MLRKIVFTSMVASGIVGSVALSSSKLAAAQAAPSATTSPHVHSGEEIFQHNCLQCHAVYEGQYSFGPNLTGELKKPHPKKTTAEVRAILKNGKGKMPAFGDKLTAPETDDLIAYLRTL